MPEEPPTGAFGRWLRHGIRTYRAEIAVAVLVIGLFLTVLAIGAFTPLSATPPFPTINGLTEQPSANYNLVFVVVGPIVVVVGAYLAGTYAVARRRFEHLMLTKSKAEFLRNIPELEDLLWDLTPTDELRYEDRRADLHLKR